MTEPVPEWHDVLDGVAGSQEAPADVSRACRLALAHFDELRAAYAAAWAPVPLPWRHTQAGDAFVGQGGHLWRITTSTATTTGWALHVARAGESATRYDGDADETVDVLVPVPMRDAFLLARAELGAQLIRRATA